jgi:hypothetical protein
MCCITYCDLHAVDEMIHGSTASDKFRVLTNILVLTVQTAVVNAGTTCGNN